MNRNVVASAEDNKKMSLEDIISLLNDEKDVEQELSNLSDEDLNSLLEESKTKEEYEISAKIRDILKEKKNIKLDEEKENEEESLVEDETDSTEKTKEEIEKEREENAKEKEETIKDLKRQLADYESDKEFYEDLISELEKKEATLTKENSKLLEDIKKAKNSWDKETIEKLQWVIKKLALEKKALRDKYAGELPKYDSQEIAKLKTRWIGFKLAGKINIDGQTMLTWPQLLFRRNIRSRNIMNKTVKALNKIWNDPKKWVKYIMTKSSLVEWWKIRAGMKNLNQFFKVRDVNTFDKIFSEQKQKFINDLESKMDKNSMSDADKKTISAIKTRLDYYHKAYKRQFIVV